MKSPEAFFNKSENREDVSGLKNFIESASAELRELEHVPVGPDGRIDMAAFSETHPDTGADANKVREFEKKWADNLTPEEAEAKRLNSDGERLEMLAHAILQKNLGDKFIVVRSSRHDDIHNGVDTILLERATGNLVCAFDEAGSSSGAEYEQKKNKILQKNVRQEGAKIKYGLSLDPKTKEIKRSSLDHVPVFYLALPPEKIEQGVKEFRPSPEEQSDFEKKLFVYFMGTLNAQIQEMRLYETIFHEELRKRMDAFDAAIHKGK